MYRASNNNGTFCVSNCESMGLFYDDRENACVGCHPACETCFGPENDQCFDCAVGYLQIDNTTCDTECYPENSFIVNDTIC